MGGMKVLAVVANVAKRVKIPGKGFVAISNLDANTGYIYVGDGNLTTTRYMIRLVPGDVFPMQHDDDIEVYLLNSVSNEHAKVSSWS